MKNHCKALTQMIAEQLVRLEVRIVEGVLAEEHPSAGRCGEASEGCRNVRTKQRWLGALQSSEQSSIAAIPRVREDDDFGLAHGFAATRRRRQGV